MILIFVLMMVLSAGRPLGVNVPAGDDIVAWSWRRCRFSASPTRFDPAR